MINVSITKQIIDKATNEANKRFEHGFRGPTVNDMYKYDMILISCIGELVFQEFLISKSIPYVFINNNFAGRELVVENKLFEIRVSGYQHDISNLNFIYNVKQYEESRGKNIDYVIQIFINGYDYRNRSFNVSDCANGIIYGVIDRKSVV